METLTQPRSKTATLLRTPETFAEYQAQPKTDKCFMCDAPRWFTGRPTSYIQKTKHWLLMHNDFPYDAVAQKHDLLVPNRHISTREELTVAEQQELNSIIATYEEQDHYDAMMENFTHARTVPGHFHIHLLTWKRV